MERERLDAGHRPVSTATVDSMQAERHPAAPTAVDGMDPLLAIENLTLRYGDRVVVNKVSLAVRTGEVLGLIGESGSGKSLTALSALGLAPGAPHTEGQIRLRGQDLIGLSESGWRAVRGRQIGIVFQDPMTSLNPLMTLGAQILEALPSIPARQGGSSSSVAPGGISTTKATTFSPRSWHGALSATQGSGHGGDRHRDRLERAARLLEEVGLPDPHRMLKRYPFELSGGQQQRAMIAMVLAAEPALLIADEPTTALDVTTQAQVLALLRDIQRRRGMAMLFISHDLDVVMSMADRVAVMRHGQLIEQGTVQDILHAPRGDYTRELIAAHAHRAKPRNGIRPAEGQHAIRTQALCVDYGRGAGRRRALHHIDLTVRQGATLGVAGESGSGKSTLARTLMGLIAPAGGDVQVCGMNPADRRQRARFARVCQYIFQDTSGTLNPRRTILQALAEPLLALDPATPRADLSRRCAAMLDEVALDGVLLTRFPHQLSGGQRQRICIARALSMQPRVLICDEPVSALDATVRNHILDLLVRLRDARGLTLVFIGHDLGVMRSITDDVLILKNGAIVEHGPTESVFSQPRADYTRALLQACENMPRSDPGGAFPCPPSGSPAISPSAIAC